MKKLVIISDTIRRDLQQPLRYFSKFIIIHLYRNANYGDMKKQDFFNTRQFAGYADLWRKLKSIDPDIVQAPEPYAGYGRFRISLKNSLLCLTVFAYCLSRKKQYFIPVFENLSPGEKYGHVRGGIISWFAKKYCQRARLFFCMNEGAIKNLERLGIDKSQIVKAMWGVWGVDLDEFKPGGEREARPTLLFVGRLEVKKGIPDLIEAFVTINKEMPNVCLLVAGDGALKSELQSMDNVEVLGVVKHSEIPALFRKSWLTVSPSAKTRDWAEQVGMVNVQSIACGTPVISTNSGSISEYMDKSFSVLVPEHSPEALAREIISLLKNSERRKSMGRNGLDYAAARYDARKNIIKMEQVLSEVFGD